MCGLSVGEDLSEDFRAREILQFSCHAANHGQTSSRRDATAGRAATLHHRGAHRRRACPVVVRSGDGSWAILRGTCSNTS
jgi:hypothetical protein